MKQPISKQLTVDTLRETIILQSDHVTVGCQRLSFEDMHNISFWTIKNVPQETPEPSPIYRDGDRFKVTLLANCGTVTLILARVVASDKFTLVDLLSGSSWGEALRANPARRVDDKGMKALLGKRKYELIE